MSVLDALEFVCTLTLYTIPHRHIVWMQDSETLKQFEMWTRHSEDKANGVE